MLNSPKVEYAVTAAGTDMTNESSPKRQFIVGLGELLWDLLPGGRQLGGAPANFALMSARLGNHASVLSRVGRDDQGRDAVELLKNFPIDLGYVQVDPNHSTGVVTVELNEGQASYRFAEPVAWDFLELSPEWQQLAARADAVCFGTLAQRSAIARQTIQSFLAATRSDCVRIFDVNLRQHYFSAEVLQESMELATILKMNEDEVPVVLRLLQLNQDTSIAHSGVAGLINAAEILIQEFPLKLVCITRGGEGSVLANREEIHLHKGILTKVADTVGAGDAYTAALTHYFLRGAPLEVLNEAGNRWGSWVASQKGAMAPLPDEVIASIGAQIGWTNQ
jgi:fructokinase